MITAGIATIPTRKESFLLTINSIIDQVDRVFVALNGYTEIPQELKDNPKIHCDILDNELYKDSAKFLHVEECSRFYLGCDDDLVYPRHYCEYMSNKATQYNALVSLHGRNFTRPVRGLKRGFTLNYHCLHSYDYDTKLDLCGSGVCCFDTNRLKLSIKDFEIAGMADVWLARQAWSQKVPIMGIAHKNNFLKYIPPPDQTLWQYWRDDSIQTRILKEFIK